jgi:carboxyl-terminal processing protease
MKKILFALFVLGCFFNVGCSKMFLGDEPENTPEVVFERFWQQINDNYSGLTVRPVNWDSLYKVYRPQVTDKTTTTQLVEIFKAMILPFDDNHLGFKAGNTDHYPSSNNNIPNYLGQNAVETAFKKPLKNDNNLFYYEKNSDNIGYVFISSFRSDKFSQALFENFDNILEALKDTKGIVIDMRSNGGGNELYAQIVAGRFADAARLYKYSRVKVGVKKDDYSDFIGSNLGNRGTWQYTKPVVVLINQRVFSTAINFVMMMQVQPHVTTLGTTTGNGVNGGITRELPNGWLLNVPSGLAYLPDKTVVEGKGVKPKIEATISEEQKKNGQDAILEKALALLK